MQIRINSEHAAKTIEYETINRQSILVVIWYVKWLGIPKIENPNMASTIYYLMIAGF